jgi:hypothetical protein
LCRVELNPGYAPRCAQTQRTGKQGFNLNSHLLDWVGRLNNRPVDLWTTRRRVAHKPHRALLLHSIFQCNFHTKRRRAHPGCSSTPTVQP